MSRAGCSAGMFSASKQCHSSSISGPSTMAKPMRVKIASIRSRTIVSGWRWPSAGARPGSVTSTAPAGPPRRLGALARCPASASRSPASARWRAGRCALSSGAARRRSAASRTRRRCSCGRDTGRGRPARRGRWPPRRAPPRTRAQPGDRVGVGVRSGIELRDSRSEVGAHRSLRVQTSGFRLQILRLRRRSTALTAQARAAVLAVALACLARLANAAGLEIASSDRLLRSSVTPAFFRPLMNWP